MKGISPKGTACDRCHMYMQETWQAMEKLVDDGLVRTIGVSNFSVKKLEQLLNFARITPAVHQVRRLPCRLWFMVVGCLMHGMKSLHLSAVDLRVRRCWEFVCGTPTHPYTCMHMCAAPAGACVRVRVHACPRECVHACACARARARACVGV